MALKRVDGVELVDKHMMRELFPDGTMQNERFFLLTKSVIMTRAYPSL